MTPRSFLLTPELADYVRAGSERPDEVAADLLAETAALAERGEVPATFQIAPEQGAFMQLLTRALGVRRLELGPEGGSVVFEAQNRAHPATVLELVQKGGGNAALE